jgi:hypothetical protein
VKLAALAMLATSAGTAAQYDVVIYGGTAGGVIAAVAAAREKATVALVEPGRHLGGMTSGGLGRTDHGKKETIGGYSLEFYKRVGKHYGEDVTWYFEPHVAEKVLREMADEAGVKVFYEHRLRREQGGVHKRRRRIESIILENGTVFEGRIFMDATYEGDLLARAGVSYTIGREGTAQYGESLAGVRPKDRNHQFDFPVIAASEPGGSLLPDIQTGPRGEIGAADKKVQAYNFRMCLSSDPKNQVAYPKPRNYDAVRWELWLRWIAGWQKHHGRLPRMNEIFLPGPLKNNKLDLNNRGAVSTDYIGGSWTYPEASYAERVKIWQAHMDYTASLLYFITTDPRVPEPIQSELRKWGLCADEFIDTNHWPHQLYVREARRMIGDFVMTQRDIQTELTKPDVIGMGSYNSDSHNVQRYVEADGAVQNEGNMEVAVKPYEIPYRVMLPKKQEVENLLVPVCMSSSHVTYSTLRMEPVYMIVGHAAGVAARMALDAGVAVQDIDRAGLTKKLKEQGMVASASAVVGTP